MGREHEAARIHAPIGTSAISATVRSTSGLLAALVETVGNDRVDLVDLARASGLLRYRAARDGQALFESKPRIMESFCLDAADFWCDAEPILRQGYEDVLAELKA